MRDEKEERKKQARSNACMLVIDCTHKKENILGFSELNYILLK